ncbi:MAG: serine hydrolase [Archangium sp.]
MKRALIAGCGTMLLLAVGIVLVLYVSEGGRTARDYVGYVMETGENEVSSFEDTEALLRYLEAHPDRYALAAWEVGHEDAGLFHDADSLWPLASTVKIIPLSLASAELANGSWDAATPTPEVENFYLPGLDGNAHPEASVDGGTSTIAGAIHGMIRFSDNAATDAIIMRLGRERLASAGPGLPTPHPLFGTMMLAANGFDGGTRAEIDDAAWAIASVQLAGPPVAASPRIPIRAQVAMTRELDNRGSARAFAQLVERIFLDGSEATAVARRELQWPMQFHTNQEAFKVFGTKGGSLPGTLTSASYVETQKGERRVVALFLHDIPFAAWLDLMSNYRQQDLERELLSEPGALERLRPRLEKVKP